VKLVVALVAFVAACSPPDPAPSAHEARDAGASCGRGVREGEPCPPESIRTCAESGAAVLCSAGRWLAEGVCFPRDGASDVCVANPRAEGCPCDADGTFSCLHPGFGIECVAWRGASSECGTPGTLVWMTFDDGPCHPSEGAACPWDGAVTPLDGCRCEVLGELHCVGASGGWMCLPRGWTEFVDGPCGWLDGGPPYAPSCGVAAGCVCGWAGARTCTADGAIECRGSGLHLAWESAGEC
jgi:hypothetical protein